MTTAAIPGFSRLRGAHARMMSDRPDDGHSSHVAPGGFFAAGGYGHEPVMVAEVLEDLRLAPGATVVDGTLGLGGHSARFLEAIRPNGTLVGIDWDENMLEQARARLIGSESVRIVLVHDDFRNLGQALDRLALRADGILLDLGLNSAQIDDPQRGFSFMKEGPLDMRMAPERGEPAAAILNRLSPSQLERAIFDLGDERWAKKIAIAIVERRKQRPLRTTTDLVECVLAAIPPKFRDDRIHPATRTFQAVRLLTTGELEGLEEAVFDAAWHLAEHGTLAILSYHSGEDRIVKNAFRELAREGFEELRKKPIGPTPEEIRANPRSRSAKLRSLRRKAIKA